MKSFEKWQFEELHNLFGLQKIDNHSILLKWLKTEGIEVAESEIQIARKLQGKLNLNISAWQEDELKSFFIIPLIEIVDFYRGDLYKSFTQRNISENVLDIRQNAVKLWGRVEFLVARGIQNPQEPFFFVHEYKPERGHNNDPIGQLLSEMCVAQAKNKYEYPVYGLYIIGRNWFFVMLQDKQYSISPAYDATDAHKLIEILKSKNQSLIIFKLII